MKLNSLKAFELVGILGVIVSLLFVSYQIQQANRIARATIEIELRHNRSDYQEAYFSDPEFALYLSQVMNTPTDIDSVKPQDRLRMYTFVARVVEVWLAAETAYESGMLSDETHDFIIEDIEKTIDFQPGFHDVYRQYLSDYASIARTDTGQRILEALGAYN